MYIVDYAASSSLSYAEYFYRVLLSFFEKNMLLEIKAQVRSRELVLGRGGNEWVGGGSRGRSDLAGADPERGGGRGPKPPAYRNDALGNHAALRN